MILRILVLFLFTTLCNELIGQSEKAYQDLQKLKEKYTNCKYYSTSIDFEIKPAEQPAYTQKGEFRKHNENYYLQLDKYTWISVDGVTYYINSDAHEISIFHVDPSEDVLTPLSILEKLNRQNFEYYDSDYPGSRDISYIDLKPLQEEDYFKIRIGLSPDATRLKSILIFNKDGSRYKFTNGNESCLTSADEQTPISFDPNQYSDYFIEDLR